MRHFPLLLILLVLVIFPANSQSATHTAWLLQVDTPNRADRAELVSLGVAIDHVDLARGVSFITGDLDLIRSIQNAGFDVQPLSIAAFPGDMADYHDHAETDAYLDDLVADYPTLTNRFSIGTSIDGRQIECLKISDNSATEENEPGFFLVARHHAREPLTTELALETASRLLSRYDFDPYVKYLVDEREIYIIFRTNPDGAKYDEDQGLVWWRKNRRQNSGQQSYCWGVDLNRNYGYEWGHNNGSSGDPCSETYRGTVAFSEPETQAVRDFVQARTNITLLISLHTYGELVMYPFAYDDVPIGSATDLAIFETSAAKFASINGYQDVQGVELYPTSGDTCDWAWGEEGLFCYTFELSPENYGGFYPADSILPSTFDGNWPAMLLAAGISSDPEMVLSAGLWKFEAAGGQTEAVIDWAPIVETNGTGYDVLRAESDAGPFEVVNATEIPDGQLEYQFIDTPPIKGVTTFYYQVRFNSTVGRHQTFGPVQAPVGIPGDDDDDDDDTSGDDDDDTFGDDDDDTADDDDDTSGDDDDDDDDDSGGFCG
jgi:carboxypeptidase T